MESRDIIVLTSPGDTDPSIAIAACRAGARGVLDLEFCADPVAAGAALVRVARFARCAFGVQLRSDANAFSRRTRGVGEAGASDHRWWQPTELAVRVRELRARTSRFCWRRQTSVKPPGGRTRRCRVNPEGARPAGG